MMSLFSPFSRLIGQPQWAANKVLVSVAAALAMGSLAAQGPFQLQLSDSDGGVGTSVLITQQHFGTIEMACDADMAGGWFEVVYDCDSLELIPQMLPCDTPYAPILAGMFGNSSAATQAATENGGQFLPIRSSVVAGVLRRGLKDGSGALAASAITSQWEGIQPQPQHWQPDLGLHVVIQNYTGVGNPLMFRAGTGNLLHFEAMRQHAMWERVSNVVITAQLVDPGDLSGLTPTQVDSAWKSAFFNSPLYTRLSQFSLRLRFAAIHLRGRNVAPGPQVPQGLLGMPEDAPVSRLSSPGVITFSASTVPATEPGGEPMFPGSILKVVEPGSTLDYRLGGFAPGMQIALQQEQGGTARYELDVQWAGFGECVFTLPSNMNLGRYKMVEVRHRILHANGTIEWRPWKVLGHQREIQVNMTGGLGN